MVSACCVTDTTAPSTLTATGSSTTAPTWRPAGTPDVPHLTPNERFFVRNHTEAPAIDADTWRLLVAGDGVLARARPTRWPTCARSRRTTYERALECTGNGRRLFADQQGTTVPGTQWGLGAIGVARWTGVPLSPCCAHAGLRADAVQVMPVGLDAAYVEDGVDHGRVRRPLPLAKALDDALVAWEMNGEPLPPDHGFPARLVVPGWVGIASIKWLGELRVTTSVGRLAVEHPVVPDARRGLVRGRRGAGPDAAQEHRRRHRPPRGRPDDRAARPGLVRRGDDRRGRGQHRRRGDLGRGDPDRPQRALRAGSSGSTPGPPAAAGEHVLLSRATDSRGRTPARRGAAERRRLLVLPPSVPPPVTVPGPVVLPRRAPERTWWARRVVSGAGLLADDGVRGRVAGVEDLVVVQPELAGPAEVPGHVDVEAGVARSLG